jgi:hypothetical protein
MQGVDPGLPSSPNTAERLAPGLWMIRFSTVETMTGEHCGHLLPPLALDAETGPLVLVASLPPGVRSVQPGLVTFWLDAMTKKGVRVRGISVVTASLAVRGVVNGFALAMKVSGHDIAASTFRTEAEAVAWGRKLVEVRQPA